MGEVDINLVLQIAILVFGAIVAWMVRKGWIDRKTIEDTKDIATAATYGIDKLKEFDPNTAKVVLREVISKIGEKKGVLDSFLKSANLNAPKGDGDEQGDGG